MKRDIALKWAEALESGKYQQGRGSLSVDDKRCCLGVLCELAIKAGVPVVRTTEGDGLYFYNEQYLDLPLAVQEWAGAKSDPQLGDHTATALNDTHRASFMEIAALIREHLVEGEAV